MNSNNNLNTGTFSFSDGDKSINSNKCRGDETEAVKTDILVNMETYNEKHKDQNWRTNAKHFLVPGSPAAMLLEASETYETFKYDFKILSSFSKTGCTSVFGNLVKAISVPSSPLALSALIWTKQNESKALLEQSLGADYVKKHSEVIDLILKAIAKDEMCSLIYPASTYTDAKPLDRATRQEIAIYYQNHSSNSKLQMSAINGHFQTRWINEKPERIKTKSEEISHSSSTSFHNNNGKNVNIKKRTFEKSFNSSNSSKSKNSFKKNKNDTITCDFCKKPGHIAKDCFHKKKKLENENNNKNDNKKSKNQ